MAADCSEKLAAQLMIFYLKFSAIKRTLAVRKHWPSLLNTLLTYLLTYLGPSLPMEHRPSTTLRQRSLFWAVLAAPVQLVPCCFSSASMSRLQLFRGRPLSLSSAGSRLGLGV